MSCTDFSDALKRLVSLGQFPVIPDLKPVSPGEGELLKGRDIADCAVKLVEAGAAVLSVVTEEEQFGGSMEKLRRVVKAADVPVLRKDFIREKNDIFETAKAGAKSVLLICAILTPEKLKELYDCALEAGLEPLVEAHSSAELELAGRLGAKLVGINNRDILQLEKDGGTVATTQSLAEFKPEGAFLISESGILTVQDVLRARESGADAALVGTAIWKSENPFEFYRELARARG